MIAPITTRQISQQEISLRKGLESLKLRLETFAKWGEQSGLYSFKLLRTPGQDEIRMNPHLRYEAREFDKTQGIYPIGWFLELDRPILRVICQ